MKTANLVSSLIAIGIAAFFIIMTFQFRDIDFQDTGPAFMPRMYAGMLVILALLLFVNTIRSKEHSKQDKSNLKLVFVTMLLITILISLTPLLGFYILTPIAVFIFLKICKEKSLYIQIGLPIGVVLFVYVLFQKILLVPIPTGTIFQ